MKTTEARAERGLRLLCTDQRDDRELVARLREGDWSALDGLYDRYARAVFQALLADSARATGLLAGHPGSHPGRGEW